MELYVCHESFLIDLGLGLVRCLRRLQVHCFVGVISMQAYVYDMFFDLDTGCARGIYIRLDVLGNIIAPCQCLYLLPVFGICQCINGVWRLHKNCNPRWTLPLAHIKKRRHGTVDCTCEGLKNTDHIERPPETSNFY
jgi:hypothetical protein